MSKRRIVGCEGDAYSILNDSNVQLSNKQKDLIVQILYPHIEYSRMEAYKQGVELGKNDAILYGYKQY